MFNKPQRHRGTEKPIFYNEEVTGKISIWSLCINDRKTTTVRGCKQTFTINFYAAVLKDGIKRLVL